MTDISASERRLIAALDRIDRCIDAGLARRKAAPTHDHGTQRDLDGVGAMAALAAANEQLVAANRAMLDADGGAIPDDAVRAAYEAEIAALTAARAAEMATMSDILDTVEGLAKHDAAPPADPDAEDR